MNHGLITIKSPFSYGFPMVFLWLNPHFVAIFVAVSRFDHGPGDAMGEVRLWPLDSIAALREAVLRLCDDSAATDAGTMFCGLVVAGYLPHPMDDAKKT